MSNMDVFIPPDFQYYKESIYNYTIGQSSITIQEFYYYELRKYGDNFLKRWFDWIEDLYEVDRQKIGLKIFNVNNYHQELRSFKLDKDNYYNFVSKITKNLKFNRIYELRYYTVHGYSQIVRVRDGVVME